MTYRKLLLSAVMMLVLMLTVTAAAQWSSDPAENTPVCTAIEDQYAPKVMADGAGGAMLVWCDSRTGIINEWSLYAQRLNASGIPLWNPDGLEICMTTGELDYAWPVSDGAGGMIIAWPDFSSGEGDIYAQRVDGSGNILWQSGGVAVCTADGTQTNLDMISDGAGGAILVWMDNRADDVTSWDIYAQRIDDSGNILWDPAGIEICTYINYQRYARLVSDNSNGVIITWQDDRGGVANIFAQRVDSAGSVLWNIDGNQVSSGIDDEILPSIISDFAGGAIIAWWDASASGYENYFINAQRVNGSGSLLWPGNGAQVGTMMDISLNLSYDFKMTPDGAGGAFFAWNSDEYGEGHDIFAQLVDSSGNLLLGPDGAIVCYEPYSNQYDVQIVTDGDDGAIISWADGRSGEWDIYAQRMNGTGTMLWTSGGEAVSTADESQLYPAMVNDGSGGAIICWRDSRSVGELDIYAQRITADGDLSSPPFAEAVNYPTGPNPQSLAIEDFDGDQINDLAMVNMNEGDVSILLGLGDGTFGPASQTEAGFPGDLAAGDFDSDGAVDLAVTSMAPVATRGGGNSVMILLGDGDGSFTFSGDLPFGNEPHDVITVDLDGDEALDLVVTDPFGDSAWVYLGFGDGTFASAVPYSAGNSPSNLTADDLDGDTVPDLAVANSSGVSVLLGIGDGTLASPVQYTAGSGPSGVAAADLDGDSAIDLVVSNQSGDDVSVLLGQGDGTFGAAVNYAVGDLPTSVTACDLTGDGTPDVAVSNYSDDTLALLVGIGDGTLAPAIDLAVGNAPIKVAAGRLDDNRSPDLVTVNHYDDDVSVLLNLNVFPAPGTISVSHTCNPSSGTLPFISWMTLTTTNLYEGQTRRIAGHIDVTLAGGQYFPNWRNGYMNAAPGEITVIEWDQHMPALGTVVGENLFAVFMEDVTPAPYNQPPYPPAGDTATDSCIVVANAP